MKILYLMNVDWNWIKQRPHFLAEELSKKVQVKTLYQYKYGKRYLFQNNNSRKVDLHKMYVVPRIDRYKILKRINNLVRKIYIIYWTYTFKPDWIYITNPAQIDSIPSSFRGKLVYDCMDDHLNLENAKNKDTLKRQEESLVTKANKIIVSSEYLKYIIDKRYTIEGGKIKVIRNGFDGSIINISENTGKNKYIIHKKKHVLAYIGTISNWFNFDYLKRSMKDIPNLEYLLIGPVDADIKRMKIKNIKFIGTVEHDKLYKSIKDCDGLIMPFLVNDIVKAVDPVKLYEYINYDKNILAVKYSEIQRFAPFVYFYSSYSEYLKQVKTLITANGKIKYSEKDRIDFLEKNNWENRAKDILNFLLKDS